MFTEPTEQHAWLRRMIGEWEFENVCTMPDGEEMTHAGTERVVAFGDLWVIGEGTMPMPEGPAMEYRLSLGYDPKPRRFVGTWFGSLMGGMFVYDGAREGDVLTLNTEGPSMADASVTVAYQDIVEIVSDDARRLSSRIRGEDGAWTTFMRGEYRRLR